MADVVRDREIRAKTKRKSVPRTTDGAPGQPVVGHVLDRAFQAGVPNQKWVVDVTHIATDEGWLCLAGVMGLCSRKFVGWSVADHMQTGPASDAPRMAIAHRCPGEGPLRHSDRGGRHASDAYMRLLRGHGMRVSTSGVGQCWDNAAQESFRATRKTELAHHERSATRERARASTSEYIEVFHNRKRVHRSLGHVSPEQSEASLN